MCNLYESIKALCESRGITGSKMCADIGISRNLLTELKSGRRSGISADKARKIAEYFGVPVGVVLGEEEQPDTLQTLKDEEKALLHSYRTMTAEQKRMMDVFIKGLKND